MTEVEVDPGPGTIGVLSASELARFHAFTLSLSNLVIPEGSRMVWSNGCSVVDNMNEIVGSMIGDWLFVLGDDHVFDPDILTILLTRMYANDLDILVPLVLGRAYPFRPVVYVLEEDEGFLALDLAGVKNDEPVIEIVAAGTAGMLIRKRVLAAIDQPWFKTGPLREGGSQLAEDIRFCVEAREFGFRVWADLTVKMGHIVTAPIWPAWHEGVPGVEFDYGHDSKVYLARGMFPP